MLDFTWRSNDFFNVSFIRTCGLNRRIVQKTLVLSGFFFEVALKKTLDQHLEIILFGKFKQKS